MKISELFFSLQGEGPTTGVPSLFIRASECNLRCNGDWKCDTWDLLGKGLDYTITGLLERIKMDLVGRYEELLNGNIHLVLTGGEPMMWTNADFFALLIDRLASEDLYTEIETNGSVINTFLYEKASQINCSPKLRSSGMAQHLRIDMHILDKINAHPNSNSNFKFVVDGEMDVTEVCDLVDVIKIPHRKVYLMPAADNRDDLIKNLPFVWEVCQDLGFNLSTRLHLEAFDKKTGI